MNLNCLLLEAAFQLRRIKMTQDIRKEKEIQKSRLNFNSFGKLFRQGFF